jgi:hypothetical protein
MHLLGGAEQRTDSVLRPNNAQRPKQYIKPEKSTFAETRLKITSVITRVHVSICTQGSKLQCPVNCRESLNYFKKPAEKVCNAACRPTAVKKLAILSAYARPVIMLVIFLQGCRASLHRICRL